MKALTAAVVAGLVMAGPLHAAEETEEQAVLGVGDTAPAFSLPGTDGKTHSLEDYLGKQAIVIAWFPKAFTGG